MNGLELLVLGRMLMKIGAAAMPRFGFDELPPSVRSIMMDVIEHPDSSISEITARTGFPQSHVSASVARLREEGALVTTIDPRDRRRTRVRAHPEMPGHALGLASTPIDDALAAALGTQDRGEVREAVAALEALAERLTGKRPPHPTGRPRQ